MNIKNINYFSSCKDFIMKNKVKIIKTMILFKQKRKNISDGKSAFIKEKKNYYYCYLKKRVNFINDYKILKAHR